MILYRDLTLILLVSCFLCGSTSRKQACPTETSIVQIYGELFTVTWKTSEQTYASVVISNPPCLDENNSLVYRICLNGTWVNKNPCHHLDLNTVCPGSFHEDDEKCIYVTPPQTFEEKCPYPDASTKIKGYSDIWLPIKQRVPYSAYEYVLPDEKYGLQYSSSDSSESSDEMLDLTSECVVKTKKIETVPCTAKYSHVCSYKHDSFLHKCPNGCVGGGLGSDYCFCKKYKNSTSIKNTCKHLATPNYTYERNIVYELTRNDTCILGYSQFRDFYVVSSNNSLHVKNIYEANCAICVVSPIPFENVDIELKFNVKSNKLFLDVYSPEGLFAIDDKVQVFCFTDATNQLKKRVEVELEFDSKSKNQDQRRFIVFKVSISENGPGDYWCEAFLLPHMTVVQSNKVLAFKKFKYSEYALKLQIHGLCRFSLIYCKTPNEEFISSVSKTLFDNPIFSKFIKNVRLFRIYDVNLLTETADALVHISVKTKLSLEDEYAMVNTTLKHIENQNVTVLSLRSSSFCLPENTFSQNKTLHWQLSSIGTKVVPQEICVRENGIPVVRKCQGDFHAGSSWENITDSCFSNYSISLKTTFLHSLILENTLTNSTSNITAVTENSSDLTVLDVHYISKILKQLSNSTQNNTQDFFIEISSIFNNLMFSNQSILKNSQTVLNSTDELLNIFEDSLESATLDNDTMLLIHNNLIIHITKPFANNISGIALYGGTGSGFLNFLVKELYSNTSTSTFENETSLELAVYIPENLLNSLATNVSSTNISNITVITTIYYRENFFNTDKEMNNTIVSKVVSVSIPGYGDYLTEPIPIVFKSKKNSSNQTCAFWNYGLQSENHTGYWSSLGGEIKQLSSNDLCFFSHLTSFALLIKSDQIVDINDQSNIIELAVEKYHDNILDIISNVGCTISVLGIFGIFLTAVLFKCWREKVGTRILMQLCIAIFLQIIFLNLATVNIAKSTSDAFCTTIGVVLHYVTVAEFTWMLVAAILQFYRFVRVIGPMPNRIILKAMLIGWGLPLIPIVLTCSINIKSYSNVIDGICYPTGVALYVGVFLPIVLIILANLTVFFIVIHNIFKLKIESQGGSQKMFKHQVCLSILLFFLLGLPWIFGLVAELVRDTSLSYIFLYIFCFTATLQGFVLFIFYVVLDKATRTLWHNLFKKSEEG